MGKRPVTLETFDLSKQEFPQVLLLGNGLCVSAGKDKSDALIKKNSDEYKFAYDAKVLANLTFPMRVAAICGGREESACGKISTDMKSPAYYASENLDVFCQFLMLPMDAFLTTNYSYELEVSLQQNFLKSRTKYLAITKGTARETQYLLHTFYRVCSKDTEKDIWHIHGEAALKKSIVLGFYNYGNLLSHYKRETEEYGTRWQNQSDFTLKPKSWLDYYIFGDVYIVGFAYDLAESDLWWLLNRKKREERPHGKVYFIARDENDISPENKVMLQSLDVQIITTEEAQDKMLEQNERYAKHYRDAACKIKALAEASSDRQRRCSAKMP